MVGKKREKPLKLIGLEALAKRVDHLPSVLIEELRIRRAGFEGEQQFDQIMKEFQPSYHYVFVHDLTLRLRDVYFQMDSVCITPFACFIFEVKNLGGKVIMKQDPLQFIHENGDRRKMINPVAEVERKAFFLQKWLKQFDVHLPIQSIVAFAYTNELHLSNTSEHVLLPVKEVPFFLYELKASEDLLSDEEIFQLAQLLTRHDSVYNPFPLLRKYPIQLNELKRGVQCENCGRFGMVWLKRSWNCSHCQHRDFHAHLTLLRDWFMLVDQRLTNRHFRWFSGMTNPDVAKRLLKQAPVQVIGCNKGRYYTPLAKSNLFQ